jgi:hypothetical protein
MKIIALALTFFLTITAAFGQPVPNDLNGMVPNASPTAANGLQCPTCTKGDIPAINSAGTADIDSLKYGTNGGISLNAASIPSYGNCFWNDVDSCTTVNVRVRERMFVGDAVLLADTRANAVTNTWLDSMTTFTGSFIARDGQFVVMTDRGVTAVAGLAQASQGDGTTGAAPIGVAAYTLNDTATANKDAWGMYSEITHNPNGVSAQSFGMEIDTRNASTNNSTPDPYTITSGDYTLALGAGAGGGAVNPSNAALLVSGNTQTFNAGIIFKDGSLTKDGSNNSIAISMGQGATLDWYTSSGTLGFQIRQATQANPNFELLVAGVNALDYGISTAGALTASFGLRLSAATSLIWTGRGVIGSPASGVIQIGSTDVASPAAQTLGFSGVLAGNANTAAANETIRGGLSNGSGGGDLILATTLSSAGSGVQNTAATALTLKGGTQNAIFAGQISVAAMTQTAAAQSGTVCYNSGTGAITYDATLGCLTSTLTAKNDWQDIAPEEALDLVTKLHPGTYTYKLGLGLPPGPQVGFAAEQVAMIDDRLVGHRPDGELAGVRYQQTSALYAGAIDALKSRMENQQRQIDALRSYH